MYSKNKLLLVGVVLVLLLASGPFCGAGFVETGVKAESSSGRKASSVRRAWSARNSASVQKSMSAQETSPLYTQSLTNALDEWEAKDAAAAGETGGRSNPVPRTNSGQVHPDDFTFDSTCATHPTCTGSTCAIPTSAYSCAEGCSNTFGTTCDTCNPTCNPTCDDTCYSTCAGSTCDYSATCGDATCSGTTCDTTCGGTTCDATCGGTTCGTDCQAPPPPPEPTTTSRTWGHDSVGTAYAFPGWELAEGCTAGGFETWILVQNPLDKPVNVGLTYMTPDGALPGPNATLPARSRKSFNVADTVPDCAEVSTEVVTDSEDSFVIAERAMYGPNRLWGHDSIGSAYISTDWYLAEGCTAGGFETWVLVQNPGKKTASVKITYMTPDGPRQGPQVKLAPRTRKSFSVAETVPDAWEVSTKVTSDEMVVAERSVYWNDRKGGHESVGVYEAAKTWYLAEGTTAPGFETFILVQNPGNKPASVNLEYMTDSGAAPGPHLDLPPMSRKTVNVADLVPDTFNVSTKVTSTQPVIAERSVYWDNRSEGHDSIGVTETATGWGLAEGSTGPGFETWILVQNPNDKPATVTIEYMTPSGAQAGPVDSIPPHGRKSYNIADTLPGEAEVSTRVISDVEVIAERAMYGDSTL